MKYEIERAKEIILYQNEGPISILSCATRKKKVSNGLLVVVLTLMLMKIISSGNWTFTVTISLCTQYASNPVIDTIMISTHSYSSAFYMIRNHQNINSGKLIVISNLVISIISSRTRNMSQCQRGKQHQKIKSDDQISVTINLYVLA